MAAQEAQTPVDETVEPLCEDEVRFYVEELFPHRSGMVRRIAFLWFGKNVAYFRVNFHDPDADNRIVKSYFVESDREGARVRG